MNYHGFSTETVWGSINCDSGRLKFPKTPPKHQKHLVISIFYYHLWTFCCWWPVWMIFWLNLKTKMRFQRSFFVGFFFSYRCRSLYCIFRVVNWSSLHLWHFDNGALTKMQKKTSSPSYLKQVTQSTTSPMTMGLSKNWRLSKTFLRLSGCWIMVPWGFNLTI